MASSLPHLKARIRHVDIQLPWMPITAMLVSHSPCFFHRILKTFDLIAMLLLLTLVQTWTSL